MKGFLLYLLKFCIPIIVYFLAIVFLDPFKVIYHYGNYYDKPIGINRDFVSTTLFKLNNQHWNYDSFIFGSSLSHAFKTFEWQQYIDGVPFHFDAFGESLFGLSTKLMYIDNQGNNIKNALIIANAITLEQVIDHDNRMNIKHPEISGTSWVRFYYKHYKDAVNPRFITAYIDYSIFKEYRLYMRQYIETYKPACDPVTNDPSYVVPDNEILVDSAGYYKKTESLFSTPISPNTTEKKVINTEQKALLAEMHNIFIKHNTNVKIIITPGYNQVSFNPDDLNYLKDLFGDQNVFDFSGSNFITETPGYYYDGYHFRPIAANIMLKYVYTNKSIVLKN